MADERETASVSEFIDFLSNPETSAAALLYNKQQHKDLLQKTCQVLFQRIESLAKQYGLIVENDSNKSLSTLPELYVGSSEDQPMDAETLWGQVDLQNVALQSLLKKSVKKLSKVADNGTNEIRLLEDVMSEEESNAESHSDGDSDDVGSDEETEEEDEETKRIKSRMERAMQDMEEEEDEDDLDRIEHDERKQAPIDEESLEDPAAEELNDGFFDINEMEAFADEEEEYLPDDAYGPVKPEKNEIDDKRSFHQKQREGDVDSGSDNEDDDDEDNDLLFRKESEVRRWKYREDDEVEALYSLYEKPKSDDEGDDDDDVVNYTAADLFGKPNKKHFDKWNAKKNQEKRVTFNDDDSWNDYDFEKAEKGGSGWNDEQIEDEEGSDVGEKEDGDDDEQVSTNNTREVSLKSKSKFARQSEKLRQQTEQLEQEMLAEKPWQMTGETTSTARPVNSLLESTPEFERASKMAPIITVEHTVDLEQTIKNRILADDWDDVVPRELPDVGWHKKRGELPEVSQEKSKLGLGELYEREYLKKAVGYDVDVAEKETEEEKAKNEMKSLFANLCSKLDALSNYHFAPRPIAEEAEVKPVTQPAIAMEEVLPLHVSDARGSAPEEVYGTKRGRDGILRNESELDQQDRKRLRSAKKAARRKARKEKEADDKLISRLQPGLGLNNPYEKRKMREELSVARARGKVTTGEADTNDYGASGTFFKRMQQEAEQAIRGEKDKGNSDGEEERARSKSSALKL